MPDLSQNDASREDRVDQVIASFLEARDRGESPDPRAYLNRFPDLALDLSRFFADQAMFVEAAWQKPGATAGLQPESAFDEPTSSPQSTASRGGPRLRYFGDYELLEEIARGCMGMVYKARQTSLDRIVALKMLLAGRLESPQDVQRFRIEAEAAAGLDHSNIVPIYKVGEHDGRHYFSMKLIDGGSLSQQLANKTLSPRQVATLAVTIARAVHYAHQRGILHRDLKPANILMDANGEPLVSDFGLAKRIERESELTQTGAVIGTPSYMAPEQASGRNHAITTATDVYGLGAVLYSALTGRPPFAGENPIDVLAQVKEREPMRPSYLTPIVDRDLDTICLKCLEKEPARRYASALALAEDLERWLRGEPIAARSTWPLERSMKWLRRHPAPAALMAVTLVAVLAVVVAAVGRRYNAKLQLVNDRLEVTANQLNKSLNDVRLEKQEADRQRTRAKEAEFKARRYLYAARMAEAEQARQQEQPDRVLQILRSVIPDDPNQDDPRGWEWHHLWRLYHGEESRLRGHKGAVTAVAFSPDDRILASGGDDATIKLWDAATGKEKLMLAGHTERVTGLSFSPTGQRLASSCADATVRIWDVAAGREILSLRGHEAAVTSVVFSSDDKHVASSSEDKTVRVWNTVTGETVKLRLFDSAVTGVDFSPDGLRIACVTYSESSAKKVPSPFIWESLTGSEVVAGDPGQSAVAFNFDGKFVATAAYPGEPPADRPAVILWDLEKQSGQRVGEHDVPITHLAFSSDGKLLASASLDQTVKILDMATGMEIRVLRDQAGVYAVAFSPDSLRVASGSGDGSVRIWSLPGVVARTLPATGTRTRAPVNNHHLRRAINVVFSPDGKRIAAACGYDTVVWHASTGRELMRLTVDRRDLGDGGPHSRVQWSPDGRFLASRDRIWNASTGTVHAVVPLPQNNSYKTAFSNDSRLLATAVQYRGRGNGEIPLFDIASGDVRRTFSMRNWATCVAISPDGKWLAAGSGFVGQHNTGQIKVWDFDSGRNGVSLEDAFYLSVWDATFSPDGRRLAAAIGHYPGQSKDGRGGEVIIWDITTGVAQHRLRGNLMSFWGVAFSPDGNRLAAAGGPWGDNMPDVSGEVKIWDVDTGENVGSLRGHANNVCGVAFSPCGRHIATSGFDGTVKIWDGTPLAETPAPDIAAANQ